MMQAMLREKKRKKTISYSKRMKVDYLNFGAEILFYEKFEWNHTDCSPYDFIYV